ncbi:MAG: hypothetical protein AAGD92_02100 [Pseudomonadota bacterium]
MPSSFSDWIAWGGIVLPLIALAWAAVVHARTRKREVAHQEYQRLFEVSEHLGMKGGSIASKVIAAYELRKFPQYGDAITRICDMPVDGDNEAARLLKKTMEETKLAIK